jgi:hypothetical protein
LLKILLILSTHNITQVETKFFSLSFQPFCQIFVNKEIKASISISARLEFSTLLSSLPTKFYLVLLGHPRWDANSNAYHTGRQYK